MNAYMATDLQLERSIVGLPMSVYQFVFGPGGALAMAILMSAPGFGGFLLAPTINRVIVAADADWRMGWGVTAVVAAANTAVNAESRLTGVQ